MGFEQLNIREAIKLFLSNTFVYKGRSTRTEFWWPVFALIIPIHLAISIINLLILIQNIEYLIKLVTIFPLIQVASFIPLMSATVRRLHDRNISGLWLLGGMVLGILTFALGFGGAFLTGKEQYIYVALLYIPLLVTLIIVLCLRGTEGRNRYDI